MNTGKKILIFFLFSAAFVQAKFIPMQFNVNVLEENLPWNLFRQPGTSIADAALFILPTPLIFGATALLTKGKRSQNTALTLTVLCATVNVIPPLLLKAGCSTGISYVYALAAGSLLTPALLIDYKKPILPQLSFERDDPLTTGTFGAMISAISMGIGAIVLGVKNYCQHSIK